LELELYSAWLKSGVLSDRKAGDLDTENEPVDDKEASEAADVMASGCVGDHGALTEAIEGDEFCSLDRDLRKVRPFGLRAEKPLLEEELEGVPESFMLRAPEKLHFFDGVLGATGNVSAAVFDTVCSTL
jgi:hypothetical protein